MTVSGSKGMASKSYSKLMLPKMSPVKITDVSPNTVTIDENGTQNPVSVYHTALAPSPKNSEKLVDNRNYNTIYGIAD